MALSSKRPGNQTLNLEIRVRSPEASPTNSHHVLVAEAADASGSDPVHCRFESCRGYQYTFVAEMAYATD